ncbi:MAG: hypothetical protein LBK44_06450 [Spirochaetales bacterium]|jgi:hypothetical protein|nr:hypothetical protein [Spirochaetales bacterium]
MRFLWAFRYNPIAQAAAQDKARQLPGRGIAEGNSAALTMRSQLWNNCVMCHQFFLRSAAKKHVPRSA